MGKILSTGRRQLCRSASCQTACSHPADTATPLPSRALWPCRWWWFSAAAWSPASIAATSSSSTSPGSRPRPGRSVRQLLHLSCLPACRLHPSSLPPSRPVSTPRHVPAPAEAPRRHHHTYLPAVVFNTDGREIPIVHRIVKVHQRADNSSNLDILTKVRLACSWLLWCCDACSWWLLPLLLVPALQLITRQPLRHTAGQCRLSLVPTHTPPCCLSWRHCPLRPRRVTTTGAMTAACTPRASCGSTGGTSWERWLGE
jgi:hypothetical protein